MIYVRHPRVLWDDLDGKLVLCHTDKAQYYELNTAGAMLWRACEGVGLETMVSLLGRAYPGIDPVLLADDVHSCVTALVDEDLLCLHGE